MMSMKFVAFVVQKNCVTSFPLQKYKMSKTADVSKVKKMSIRLFLIQKIMTTFVRMWFFIEIQNIFNLHKTCFFSKRNLVAHPQLCGTISLHKKL